MSLPLLQMPKTKTFFGGLKADDGHTLLYADGSAIEPHVCAYYSRDKSMLKLYKNGAPANDIYIFFGSATPQYGARFRELGYNPDAPTKDAIKAVKAACPTERGVCKKIILGCNYGMGPDKLQAELSLAGFSVTLEDAKIMHAAYWEFFGGIKAFGRSLKDEWKRNGGYILGPRGEPICIPKPYKYWDEDKQKNVTIDYTKDIVNRFVQRGGHDVHMRFIYLLNTLRLEREIPMTPFHCDWHDSSTWQVPLDRVDDGIAVYKDAASMLNQQLDWDVTIKYEPKIGSNMADFLED
jgi:hypothetical protein